MAKFEVRGIEEYAAQLQRLDAATRDRVVGKTVYQGAKVAADAIKNSVEALPVGGGRGGPKKPIDTVTPDQLNGLRDGFGISRMEDDQGFIHVKLGWSGCNRTRTKKYPGGQPNSMIAWAVNSGTTVRRKTRFLDKAMSGSKPKVLSVMSKTCDTEIGKIMKGS